MSQKSYRKKPNKHTLQNTDTSIFDRFVSKFNVDPKNNPCYDPCHGGEQTGRFLTDTTDDYSYKRLEHLDETLPSLSSTVDSIVNLIMSQSLVGSGAKDLNRYLKQHNRQNQTNYQVLIQGLQHALIYGRCGFRVLSNQSLMFYSSNQYTVVYEEDTEDLGLYTTKGYIVTRDQSASIYGLKYEIEDPQFEIDLENDLAFNDEYLYLKPNRFYNFHFFGDQLNIDTPLNHDLYRIEMFSSLVRNLNKTIGSANTDVTLVKVNNQSFDLMNKTASDVMSTSLSGKRSRTEAIMQSIQSFANKVGSTLNRVALIVPSRVEEVENVSSNVELADFLDLYEHIEEFICKIYGVSQNVLSLESLPRDASANPIFEQMMKLSIYPKREVLLQFLNNFVLPFLGDGKVVFEEESYTEGLRIQSQQYRANMVSTLSNAVKSLYQAGYEVDSKVIEEYIIGGMKDELEEY